MSITRKDVEHIAHLARIELSDIEKEKFEKDLSSILSFVEILNQIRTEHIMPMTGGTVLENIMREDEIVSGDLEEKALTLLQAAPETHEEWVRVESVFEKNE